MNWHHNPFVPLIPPHQPTFKIFGVGLALGLWLYSGYEQLSTVAEEVENPQRAYPRALALVVPLSIAAYFLPTLAGLASAGKWEKWHTGFFSDAATDDRRILFGRPWLGTWMTLAAMVATLRCSTAPSSPPRACPLPWPKTDTFPPRLRASIRGTARRGWQSFHRR